MIQTLSGSVKNAVRHFYHFAKKAKTRLFRRGGVTVRPATLVDLPQEMIERVLDFLPPSSAACLALSCKSMRRRIGTRSWLSVLPGETRADRHDFLKALEKDYPWSLHCHACNALHTMTIDQGPTNSRYEGQIPLALPCQTNDQHVRLFRGYHLDFQYYHIVMKQHRMRSTGQTRVLKSLNLIREDRLSGIDHSVTSQIIDNELVLLVKYKLQRKPRGMFLHNLARTKIYPYMHLTEPYFVEGDDPFVNDTLATFIRCHPSHTEKPSSHFWSTKPQYFFSCFTKYIISSSKDELSLTFWLNLGSGQQNDVKWRDCVGRSRGLFPEAHRKCNSERRVIQQSGSLV